LTKIFQINAVEYFQMLEPDKVCYMFRTLK
jgi:hypothetical protein